MAFVVEDGTGLSTATSYASLEFSDDYHRDHGNTCWLSMSVPDKRAALMYGSTWMDAKFEWIGRVCNQFQRLDWPRVFAWDDEFREFDGLPDRIREACSEVAYLHTRFPLNRFPDAGRSVDGSLQSVKVDVVEVRFAGDRQSVRNPDAAQSSIQAIENILSGLFITGGAGESVLVRG